MNKILEIMTYYRAIDTMLELCKYNNVEKKFLKNNLKRLHDVNNALLSHSSNMAIGMYNIKDIIGDYSDEVIITSGLMHDIGKSFLPKELFNADGKAFRNKPLENHPIKTHPAHGFKLLARYFPTAAVVAGHHHKYQDNSYFGSYPDNPQELSDFRIGGDILEQGIELSKWLSIIDFYEALGRKNERYTNEDPMQKLYRERAALTDKIDILIENNLLTPELFVLKL